MATQPVIDESAAKPAQIDPTPVNVVFEPNPDLPPVPFDLTLPASQPEGLIGGCEYHRFMFSFFKGTIEKNVTLVAVPMILPAFFEEIGMKGNKKDVRKLFLLRTSATEGDHKSRIDFFNDKGLGPHGCPAAILVRTEANKDSESRNYFSFNNMRFYPFLMRELTVGYYVCDEGATSCHWPKYQKGDKGVALDYPVAYDATLGLFTTRGARYIR